jgi:hypothetical protein
MALDGLFFQIEDGNTTVNGYFYSHKGVPAPRRLIIFYSLKATQEKNRKIKPGKDKLH